MNNVNFVTLAGRLVADPKLRHLPSGAPVVGFSVAVNRTSKKKDGSYEDTLEGFFDCEAFDNLATAISQQFTKGAAVQLTGTLLQKTYEGNDGNQVRKFEIRVRAIGAALLPAKADKTAPAAQGAEPQPA